MCHINTIQGFWKIFEWISDRQSLQNKWNPSVFPPRFILSLSQRCIPSLTIAVSFCALLPPLRYVGTSGQAAPEESGHVAAQQINEPLCFSVSQAVEVRQNLQQDGLCGSQEPW